MSMADKFIKAGFRFDGAAVFPILNLQYDENSYSWGLAQIVRNFVAGKNDVSIDDLKDWHGEFERLSEAGRYFFSSNRYIFKASKPSSNAYRAAPTRLATSWKPAAFIAALAGFPLGRPADLN
jgi:hypothetical protein